MDGPEDRRDESDLERLDRNWNELLQELRVAQTGVQILTGFLLTIPFQQRFEKLSDLSQDLYLATVGASIAATGALVAPVGIHRILFRQHARGQLVASAHRCALAGLTLLALAMCGAAYIVTALVVGVTAGAIAAGLVGAGLVGGWLVLP